MNTRIRREQIKLKATERRADTRRKVLAGAAALEWAKQDSEFSAKLMAKLKSFLVGDGDRERRCPNWRRKSVGILVVSLKQKNLTLPDTTASPCAAAFPSFYPISVRPIRLPRSQPPDRSLSRPWLKNR